MLNWALKPHDASKLDKRGRLGRGYARAIANGCATSAAEIARKSVREVSERTVRRHIARAKAQLAKEASGRICAEPLCPNQLPANAHGNRRFCEDHGAGAARTARHRRPKY